MFYICDLRKNFFEAADKENVTKENPNIYEYLFLTDKVISVI